MSVEGRALEVEANGLRFHVREYGRGERLALCLHGFPQTGHAWLGLVPYLVARGFRVWAPDLRGYGRTDRPQRTRDYAIETLMDDVEALIDAAGVDRATVLAHDWGGVVAWHLAMRRPERFERFVPINIPHPQMMRRELIRGPQLRRSTYVFAFQLPWLPERALRFDGLRFIDNAMRGMAVRPERIDDAAIAHYRAAAAEPGALHAMLAYYRAYIRGGGALREQRRGMPVIEVPTLLLWGEHDTALGRETTVGTEDVVADFTLRFVPHASHWLPEEAPETIDAMLGAWLAGEAVPEAWEIET